MMCRTTTGGRVHSQGFIQKLHDVA